MTFLKMTVTSIVLGLALLASWSLGKDQPQSEQTCCDKLQEIKELLGDLLRRVEDTLRDTAAQVLELLADNCGGGDSYDLKRPDDSGSRDCYDLKRSGHITNGVYSVKPDGTKPFKVYCDMENDGGGWTVFQRREDGSVNFNRNWADYKDGFGELDGEHWLGNDKLFYLTNQQSYTLRIDMEDFEDERRYAVYDSFAVASSSDHYRLSLGGYSGDAGNAMSYHSDQHFTTLDHDHDENTFNCAQTFKGGWWFKSCFYANLNGQYKIGGRHSDFTDGITWWQWHGYDYSLKVTEMKFRPSLAA